MPDGGAGAAIRDSEKHRLFEIIQQKSVLRGGTYRLSSGKETNVFFDMKTTMLDPEGANLIASLLLEYLKDEDVQGIGGMVMGAVPIVSVVCAKSFCTSRPVGGFFVRKEAKGHGTNKLIDGNIPRGMRVILIDDVTTTGSSVLGAVRAARDSGCRVDKVISVLDRCQGAKQALRDEGISLVSIFSLNDFDPSHAPDSAKDNGPAG